MWSSRPPICPLPAATTSLLWLTVSPSVARVMHGTLSMTLTPGSVGGIPRGSPVRRERTTGGSRTCPRTDVCRDRESRPRHTAFERQAATSVVVVTLVVVALVVVTLVGVSVGQLAGVELVEVDLGAGGVDDLGLLEDRGQGLAARDLGDHGRDLAGLVDRLGELVGLHAVLR